MKTSNVGIVAAAILLALAGAGIGIAQAGGTHSEQPVLSFDEMEAIEKDSSSSDYIENRPVSSFEDQELPQLAESPSYNAQLNSARQEFVPEDNWSGTDWQTRGPVETGAIPGAVFEAPWMSDYGND